MKKSERGVVRLTFNLEIVETVATRREPVSLETWIGDAREERSRVRLPGYGT